eukprot:3295307-Amphidinium_carterae.3
MEAPTFPYPWHRDGGNWMVIGDASEVVECLRLESVHDAEVTVKGIVTDIDKLPHVQREMFTRHARLKEAASVLPSIEEVNETEAKELERRCPERILGSRWLETWKFTDQPQQHPEGANVSDGKEQMDHPRILGSRLSVLAYRVSGA